MSKVFISRPNGSVSWGFRLEGGLEYNEPLTVTNIVPNSPADGKIDPGDMLIEIAGNNATYMTHQNALELIQRCANALFLTVHKLGFDYPPGATQPQPAPIPPMWRPAGQQQQFNYQQQPSYGYGQPTESVYNTVPPTSMPLANIPVAPIFDADLIANPAVSLKSHQPVFANHSTFEQTTEISNIPAVLAKSLARPGGPKPFTYTPGGLDLSKIRESARVRRHRECISNSEETNDTQEIDQIMSRRMIVPSEKMNQHHYAGTGSIQPFSYARQQPTAPTKYINHDTDAITQSRSFQMLQGWISDSEKLVPTFVAPPSPSATTTNRSAVSRAVLDEHSHFRRRASSGGTSTLPSRSFRYLQEQYNDDNIDNNTVTRTTTKTDEERRLSSGGSGLRRSSDAHTPSRSFRYLQDQYDTSDQLPLNRSQTVNNRNDLMEIYHKPPPSFRAREPEAPRYSGSTVPSRSFRFLQMMTGDDQQNNSQPVPGYNKPQQLLLNKYDEQTLLTNINRLHDHPSRSFKYLQEMTGEHQPTRTERRTNGGQPFNMHIEVHESQPIVQVNTTSSSLKNFSRDIGASDF